MVQLLTVDLFEENQSVFQISEYERRQMEETYFVSLLQACDQGQVPKSIKYKASFVLRSLVKYQPDLIFCTKREQFLYGSIKIALMKSKLQHPFLSQNSEDQVSYVSPEVMQQLQVILPYCVMDSFFDEITPFEILAGISNALGKKSILIRKTQFSMDFAISFPQTFDYTENQIVQACMSIALSQIDPSEKLQAGMKQQISTNVLKLTEILKVYFEYSTN